MNYYFYEFIINILKKNTYKFIIIFLLFVSFNYSFSIENKKFENHSFKGLLEYKAKEIVNNFTNKKSYLIENAEIKYQNLLIKAFYIVINWETCEIYGKGKSDSTGKIIEQVKFQKGSKKYEYNEFKFNYKKKTGLALEAKIIEDDAVIFSKNIYRSNDSIFYMKEGFYSTDLFFKEKKDSIPDYYLKFNQVKYIQNKSILTGLTQMYIQNIPMPFILPFFYIPDINLNTLKKKTSPLFGIDKEEGFFIKKLGYNFDIGKNIDLMIYANIFSKGNWDINSSINYTNKNEFNNFFNANYSILFNKINETKEYKKLILYNIKCIYTKNLKLSSDYYFVSKINLMNSTYFKYKINEYNIFQENNFKNIFYSSLFFQKKNIDSFFYTIFNINQIQRFEKIEEEYKGFYNLKLPQITCIFNRKFIFNKRFIIKSKLLENLNISHIISIANNFDNIEENNLFNLSILKNLVHELKNHGNISTYYNLENYLSFIIKNDYESLITIDPFIKNNNINKLNIIEKIKIFNFNTKVQTRLFGSMKFRDNKFIQSIHHTIIPIIKYEVSPFNSLKKEQEDDIYISKEFISKKPLYNKLNFELINDVEIKLKNSKNNNFNKIKLLENVSIQTSYNLSSSQFKWSDININGGINIFENQFKIDFNVDLNPYQVNKKLINNQESFFIINKFNYFWFRKINLSLIYILNSKNFYNNLEKKLNLYKKRGLLRDEVFYFDEENYSYFNYEWNGKISLIYNYNRKLNLISQKKTGFLEIQGFVKPSPYWNLNIFINYDIMQNEIIFSKFNFYRDLRSFKFNFTCIPSTKFIAWHFLFEIKSNIFKNIFKYEAINSA